MNQHSTASRLGRFEIESSPFVDYRVHFNQMIVERLIEFLNLIML